MIRKKELIEGRCGCKLLRELTCKRNINPTSRLLIRSNSELYLLNERISGGVASNGAVQGLIVSDNLRVDAEW